MTPEELKKYLSVSYSYAEYWELIRKLTAENKTTGTNHSEDYLHYTKLNIQRMERQDERIVLNDSLIAAARNLGKSVVWLMLTEWWCGDVSQNLPTIAKIADASEGKINLRLLLRDENLELMDRYLTNGGRSIPKLIAIDPLTGTELKSWGPRPEPATEIFRNWKANPEGRTVHQFHEELHKWYIMNKNQVLMAEMEDFIKN